MKVVTLCFMALILLPAIAVAKDDVPAIAICFDAQATQTSGIQSFGPWNATTAYIFATHTEQTVGGAAFRLVLDPRITLTHADYPPGIQVGTLTEGIQIGLTNCEMGYYGRPVLLATLYLTTASNFMFDAPLSIASYPPAGAVQLADCWGPITEIAGESASLTVYPPTRIGLFFDPDASSTSKLCIDWNQIVTAYVIIVESEQQVGGCAYQVLLDTRIALLGHVDAPGVEVGDLLTGAQVTFSECQDGRGGANVLVSTLTLSASGPFEGADIRVSPHPGLGSAQIVDCGGSARQVEVGWGHVFYEIGADEAQTWGEVKRLYGR